MSETANLLPTDPAPDQCEWFAERPHPTNAGMIQVAWFATEAEARAQVADWGVGRIWQRPESVRQRVTDPAPDRASLLDLVERWQQAHRAAVNAPRDSYGPLTGLEEQDYIDAEAVLLAVDAAHAHAEAQQELQHWRSSAEDHGHPDAHSWSLSTDELTAALVTAQQTIARLTAAVSGAASYLKVIEMNTDREEEDKADLLHMLDLALAALPEADQ